MTPDVQIDTRPLWIVLLSRSRQAFLIATGIAIYWLLATGEPWAGLSVEGQKALAVFGLCAFYWVLNVLPLMITSLLAIVLLPLTDVMGSKEAYQQFGNEAVFFILGAFILAAAMMKSGLSARLALLFLKRFGERPSMLLLGVFLSNAVMSFFMSEHAVAAMTFPIVVEIAAALGIASGRRTNYGRALFLALAWGSTIGGVGTLLGGARAPLALGILREVSNQGYSFFEWAALNLPLVAILLGVGWVVINLFYPIDIHDTSAAQSTVREKLLDLGRMSGQETAIASIMILTVVCWIFLGEEFGLASIALAAVVVLFAFGVVRWHDVEGYVNWGLILMYGGAICLGQALNRTGAAHWLANETIVAWADGPVTGILLISTATIVLTEMMSNSAAVAIVMPLSLAVAPDLGIDTRLMAPVVAVPAGLAFLLPIGTPANAIAYSSGFLRVRDMALPGLVLSVTAITVFNVLIWWYWPLLGVTP